MKGFLSITLISSLVLSIGCAHALDIQPGEWKVENSHMHIVDNETGQVLADQKNSGTTTLMCYTPKMSADAKKMKKGFSTSILGCTMTYVESSDTKLINETVCSKEGSKTHSLIETTKISDTEFALAMKMDIDSPARKISTTQTIKQTFVGKNCSEASKTAAQ